MISKNKDYMSSSQKEQCSIKLSMKDEQFIRFIEKSEVDFPSRIFDLSLKEQFRYRLYICKRCYEDGSCKVCGCNPDDTFVEIHSCNKGESFPNLMNKFKWENFKKEMNLIFEY